MKWTKLVQVNEGVQIICMALLNNVPEHAFHIDDWVALGDGQGNMTIVRVMGHICEPKLGCTYTWSAAVERQLLGTYWSRSLGYRYEYSAYPILNVSISSKFYMHGSGVRKQLISGFLTTL